VVGIVLAVGLAFFIEYLDDTVKSPDAVTEVIGVPTLGVITRMKPERKGAAAQRLMTVTAPRSAAAEAYRALRTNLEFASVDAPLESLLVTSAIPGEGKTTSASNIAAAFAQAGRRVLLLDADMRRPGIHRMFELPNSHGLTNLLRSEEPTIASVAHVVDPNLRVITTGPLPPNPAELLASQRMDHVLELLLRDSDLLVVDSPPLHAVTDAAILASHVTGTLIVIDAGRTRRGALRQAKEALDRVGARLLGAVLNRLSERARGGYYYYSYGEYSVASSEAGAEKASDARRAADSAEQVGR
jgi:capsular exopolysaccharide synthesis family protein